jgi:hypothetical protein
MMLGSSRRYAVIASLLLIAILVLSFTRAGPTLSFDLDPTAIAHQDGHRYVTRLKMSRALALFLPADSAVDTAASTATLWEDDVDIGRAHSFHAFIAKEGMGRFSHWGNRYVLFSASDGSDPRTNGRHYRIEATLTLPPWAAPVALGLLLILWRREIAASALTIPTGIALVVLIAAAWVTMFPGRLMISPDSATYLTFHRWVPLGYPVFLAAIADLVGLTRLPVVQIGALFAAILFLGLSVYELTCSRIAFAATVLVLAGYSPLIEYTGFALSEAPYTALLFTACGAGLRLLGNFRPGYAVLFAAAIALAWSVRPGGIYLLGVMLYLALLLAREVRIRRIALWLIAPTIAFFGAIQLAHYEVRGPASSQAGRVLFAQAAFWFDPDQARADLREDAERVAAAVRPHKKAFKSIKGWANRHNFATNNYPVRLLAAERALGKPFEESEPILMEFAVGAMAENWPAYMRWVLEDVAWTWEATVLESAKWSPTTTRLSYRDRENERIDLIRNFELPLTLEEVTIEPSRMESPPELLIEFLRHMIAITVAIPGLVIGLGIALFACAIAAPFTRHRTIRGLGLLAAVIHGSIFAISAATLSIPRYVVPIDPLILVAGVLMAHAISAAVRHAWSPPADALGPTTSREAGAA